MAVCGFCKRGEGLEMDALCGRLHSQKLVDGKICSAHHKCMQYSASLVQYNFDSFGGFKIDDVIEEMKRGKSLKCSICRYDKDSKTGATSGCALQSCRRTYHFYCVAASTSDSGPFFKRLVLKLGNERRKVLYRVFCCKDHEDKYKESLKDEIKKKNRTGYQSSDDNQEENESDSEQEGSKKSTSRTSQAGASASTSLRDVPVLGTPTKELRVSISPMKTTPAIRASVSGSLPKMGVKASGEDRENGSAEGQESKSPKKTSPKKGPHDKTPVSQDSPGDVHQNGDVDEEMSAPSTPRAQRGPGRLSQSPKMSNESAGSAPSGSVISKPQEKVAAKKRGRPPKNPKPVIESASDPTIQKTSEEPEQKRQRVARSSSAVELAADEDAIEVVSTAYIGRRSGRTPQMLENRRGTPSIERAAPRKRAETRQRPSSPGQSSPESTESLQRNVVADVHNEHVDSSEQIALCFPLFDGASNALIRSLVTTHFPDPQKQTFIWQDIQTEVSMTPNLFIHFVNEVVKAFRDSKTENLKTLLFDKAAVQKKIMNEYSYTSKLLEESDLEGDVKKHLTKRVEMDLETAKRNFRCQVGGVIRTQAGVICVLIFNEQTDPHHAVRKALFETLPLVSWDPSFTLPSTLRPTADQQDQELQKLKLWLCGKILSQVAVFPKEDLLKKSSCVELEEFLKANVASNLEPGQRASTAVMFHALDPQLVQEVAYIGKALQGYLGSLPSRDEVIIIIEAEVVRRNPDALKKLQKEALKSWEVQVSSVFDPAVTPLSWIVLVLSSA